MTHPHPNLPPRAREGAKTRIELNGQPARAEDLRYLVQTNYGHFTAMRAENGGVRGLDLHLDRLQRATRELFGSDLDRERVRGFLRHAIDGDDRPLSLRVNVFSRALNRELLTVPVPPDVLVIVAAASPLSITPLRLKSFRYTRDLAAIKHVGTFPLFHYRKLAQEAGFDDALFVDEDGCIGEGSVWNIGFADDRGVVWPEAQKLEGISLQLLQSGLAIRNVPSTTRPVHLHDLANMRAAFFTNTSVPVRPIASIDEFEFRIDAEWIATLTQGFQANPPQSI